MHRASAIHLSSHCEYSPTDVNPLKVGILCVTMQGSMQQCLLVGQAYLYGHNRITYKINTPNTDIHMHLQSPFSSPSEEQKQVLPHLEQCWALLSPEAPLLTHIQPESERQQAKSPFELDLQPNKSAKKGRRASEQSKDINRGHWSSEQNKKYHWFLEIHYKHFINRHMRRTDKIFKTMEIFIGTRQAEQCRSHHQKMEKKYLNFVTIISNLRDIHYATQDTLPLQQQIEANGVEIFDRLASMQQLKAYKQVEDQIEPVLPRKMSVMKSPKPHKTQERSSVHPPLPHVQLDKLEQHKQGDNGQIADRINMFEQLQNDIGELGMYHYQKQESGIFQSFFQYGQ